jgi:hypothetical protein
MQQWWRQSARDQEIPGRHTCQKKELLPLPARNWRCRDQAVSRIRVSIMLVATKPIINHIGSRVRP